MAQITITADFNRKNLEAFLVLSEALDGKVEIAESVQKEAGSAKAKKATPKTEPAQEAGEQVEMDTPAEKTAAAVSLSDIRAAALVFSKAGKQAVLKGIFAKYGAEKLSDISEDLYPELMADLEAANA